MPLDERPPIRSKQELMEMYPECFNDTVGCFEDYTYYITLDPKVPPVVHAPRKIPIELKDKLQAELEEMENQGIMARVTTHRLGKLSGYKRKRKWTTASIPRSQRPEESDQEGAPTDPYS